MMNPKVVKAVHEVVLSTEAEDGYVSVLYALAELMAANTNEPAKTAGKLVRNLAHVLNVYLGEPKNDHYPEG